MKKRRVLHKVMAVALSATMLFSTGFTTVGQFVGTDVSVSAADTTIVESGKCGDNVTYTLDSNGTLTISGSGNMTDYYGDNDYCTAPYSRAEIKKVTIQDGVTSIGEYAFYRCTGLTSIEIPDSVTSIGESAFVYCTSLTSIVIPDRVISIGWGAFAGCTNLTSIVIPDSVTKIGGYAFNATAWYNNQPDGIVYVKKILYKYKGTMPKNTRIIIPDNVVSIGEYAFEDCTGLRRIEIPDSVTEIGKGAFSNCTGLVSVTIGDRVTSIGWGTFSYCTGLTSVFIPKSVVEIERSFMDCRNFEDIYYEGTEEDWSKISIDIDNIDLLSATIHYNCQRPDSTETTIVESGKCGDNVTYTLDSNGTLIISGSGNMTNYDYDNYYNCSTPYNRAKIDKVIIRDGVTSIGNCAFWRCTGLTSITIPDSVTSIGIRSFEECTGLTSVIIGNGVTEIGWAAFEYCTDLTSIVIPKNVAEIGDYTFFHTGLTRITIPKNVTKIGYCAFEDCANFDVYYEGTEEDWNKIDIDTSDWTYALLYATKHYNYQYSDSNELKNNSEISADKIVLGGKVNVTAKASGGKGDYTYAIYYKKKSDTKWTMVQNFNANTTATFKPAKATEYDVCIKVKDADGKITKKYFTITVNGALENISDIWTNGDTICLGETVAVNAYAKGGTGEYTYAVYYKQTTQTKWTTKQDFNSNSVVYIKPAKPVDYDICIKVKDSSGKVVKKYFSLTVYPKLTNTSTIESTSVTYPEEVKIHASATGGADGYTYALYCKKKSESKWSTKQDFDTNAELSFRPMKVTDYDVCVKVKDSKGNIAKKYFDVTVKQNPTYNISVKYLEKISLAQYLEKPLNQCGYDIADTKIANIANSAESTIEGLKVGATTMQVHDGVSLKTFNISVIPNDMPPEITPATKKLKLKVGETGTFTCKPRNGIDGTVTYSTYSSSICTISQKGTVKAYQVGYGTVAARLSDGQIITCTVEVTK